MFLTASNCYLCINYVVLSEKSFTLNWFFSFETRHDAQNIKKSLRTFIEHVSIVSLTVINVSINLFQLNMVTSWIDGSFIYSTSETWVNTMRSFKNGTFKTDPSGLFPPRNKERAPLINAPPAHHLKMITPERMFCKFNEPYLPYPPLSSIYISVQISKSHSMHLTLRKSWVHPTEDKSIVTI